jgi:long-subunit acyl-CoA synthetase (AMP-forming)
MTRAPDLVAKYDLSSVNAAVVGSSNLSKDAAAAFDKLVGGAHLIQGYGLTETTVAVTFANPLDEMFGTCGHLFPSCQARLIDEHGGEITEHGKAGELLIRSPTVFLGYLNNEVATNETFTEDGWLRTGDLVEFRKSEKGHDHLFVIDRLKEMIKVRVRHSVCSPPLNLCFRMCLGLL